MTSARLPQMRTTPPKPARGGSFLLVAILALASVLVGLTQLVAPAPAGALPNGPQGPFGVPPGTVLTLTGSLVVTQPGTVLDSLEINGCVKVLANDVLIIRSRITCDGAAAAVSQVGGAAMLNIVDSVIRGGADPAGAGVWSDQPYAVIRTEITNVTDGVFLGNWGTLDSSWVHDLSARPGDHNDLVQVVGGANVFVRNNLLEHRTDQTSAIMVKSDMGPIDNVNIEGNVIAGGLFSVYVMAGNALGGCCDVPTNVHILNNVFRAGSSLYDPVMAQGAADVQCNKLDTGVPLTFVTWVDRSGAQVNGCPY